MNPEIQASSPSPETYVTRAELLDIRDSLGATPHFPVPPEWTILIHRENGQTDQIITPLFLRDHYGINFQYNKIAEVATNEFAFVPANGFSIYIRAEADESFKTTFGFLRPETKNLNLNALHIINSLDIVIVQAEDLCNKKGGTRNLAYINDYAGWVYGSLEKFKLDLLNNRQLLRGGLPHVSLPNGENLTNLYMNGLTIPYLDFSGSDIDKTVDNITKFQKFYDIRQGSENSILGTRRDCEAATAYMGRACGPMPELVVDAFGKPITDSEEQAFIRLRSRIYCDLDPQHLLPGNVGELLTHETSHAEAMIIPEAHAMAGRLDEHLPNDVSNLFTHDVTRKSRAYALNAQEKLKKGDTSGLLFLVEIRNNPFLANLIASPVTTTLGTVALGAGNFFGRRMGPVTDGQIDRARFLALSLGAAGLIFLGNTSEKAMTKRF